VKGWACSPVRSKVRNWIGKNFVLNFVLGLCLAPFGLNAAAKHLCKTNVEISSDYKIQLLLLSAVAKYLLTDESNGSKQGLFPIEIPLYNLTLFISLESCS
jgi:hypothetical protein